MLPTIPSLAGVDGGVTGGGPSPPAGLAFGAALGPAAFATPTPLTTVTFTTNVTVPAGGLLVVGASYYCNGTATFSGGGLTWTTDLAAAPNGTDSYRLALGSAPAPAGLASGTVITATISQTAFALASCGFYLTGADVSAGRADVIDAATATNGTAQVALTTTNAIDALVCFGWSDQAAAAGNSTPVASFTEVFDFANSDSDNRVAMGYRLVSSTGTYTVGGTFSLGARQVAVAVAYKGA